MGERIKRLKWFFEDTEKGTDRISEATQIITDLIEVYAATMPQNEAKQIKAGPFYWNFFKII